MKLRALIIDDSSTMRTLLTQLLPLTELAQFEFTEASDGLEALARFDPKNTDIVFVDWRMPRMTGYDFVCKIRASGEAARIPMVMVSGEMTIGEVEEALIAAGVDEYIVKPFTVDSLRQRLASLIDRMALERKGRTGSRRSDS